MRCNIFSKKCVQSRYLLIIFVAMFVPAVLVGSFLYYFIFTITAEQIGVPEMIAENLLPVVDKINFLLLIGLLPLCGLILMWGLVLSHRFCGPLERIENDADKILAGDSSVRFKVREKDDIRNIVYKLNKVLDMFEKRSA